MAQAHNNPYPEPLPATNRTLVTDNDLFSFQKESNRIEGILSHDGLNKAVDTLAALLAKPNLSPDDLAHYRMVVQPNAILRNKPGVNVQIGNHLPPLGGPAIRTMLKDIVGDANLGEDPFLIHQRFESLHPYTDGNGRTGRALWLWQMVNQHGYRCQRRFLHEWYYQSLQHQGQREPVS